VQGFVGIKNILVIKLRNIGDVLLTVPAIRALRETFPGARISALVNPGTEQMLTLNPLVDEVIVMERGGRGRGVRASIGFIRKLRARGFEMTVDLTGGDRAAFTGFLTGAKFRLGPDPAGRGFTGKAYLYTHRAAPPPPMTHTVIRNLSVLRPFGIDTKDLAVDFFVGKADEDETLAILEREGLGAGRPFVHVHPVSRWLFKCPVPSLVAGVLDGIVRKGLPVVITSGPEAREMAMAREIERLMKEEAFDLSGIISLKGLGALSKRAAFFFGVDSAPMHIAAAVGAPVVALFGPSGAFDWGPWDNEAARGLSFSTGGPLTPYPSRSGVQRFGKNTVIQDTRECVPCGKDGCGGSKKSKCLDELDPKLIAGVLDGYIGRAMSI